MSERHEMIGQRATLKPERQRLTIECEALRSKLRGLLPPHEEVEKLDGERIVATAAALQTSLIELNGVARKIAILTQELGGE